MLIIVAYILNLKLVKRCNTVLRSEAMDNKEKESQTTKKNILRDK